VAGPSQAGAMALELDLLPQQVQEPLRQGSLRPLDLVHEGGAWTTLHKSIQFGEAAEPSHRRAQTKAPALMVVMMFGGLVGRSADVAV